MQSSGEFSTCAEVVGEFSFDGGFLWNFSFFMFDLAYFPVYDFL